MDKQRVIFKDANIEITENLITIGRNHYDVDSISFVTMFEKFGGFRPLGWLIVIVGVFLMPFYGVGLIVMMVAWVWFQKVKYVIQVVASHKEQEIFHTPKLTYAKEVLAALNKAVDISFIRRSQ